MLLAVVLAVSVCFSVSADELKERKVGDLNSLCDYAGGECHPTCSSLETVNKMGFSMCFGDFKCCLKDVDFKHDHPAGPASVFRRRRVKRPTPAPPSACEAVEGAHCKPWYHGCSGISGARRCGSIWYSCCDAVQQNKSSGKDDKESVLTSLSSQDESEMLSMLETAADKSDAADFEVSGDISEQLVDSKSVDGMEEDVDNSTSEEVGTSQHEETKDSYSWRVRISDMIGNAMCEGAMVDRKWALVSTQCFGPFMDRPNFFRAHVGNLTGGFGMKITYHDIELVQILPFHKFRRVGCRRKSHSIDAVGKPVEIPGLGIPGFGRAGRKRVKLSMSPKLHHRKDIHDSSVPQALKLGPLLIKLDLKQMKENGSREIRYPGKTDGIVQSLIPKLPSSDLTRRVLHPSFSHVPDIEHQFAHCHMHHRSPRVALVELSGKGVDIEPLPVSEKMQPIEGSECHVISPDGEAENGLLVSCQPQMIPMMKLMTRIHGKLQSERPLCIKLEGKPWTDHKVRPVICESQLAGFTMRREFKIPRSDHADSSGSEAEDTSGHLVRMVGTHRLTSWIQIMMDKAAEGAAGTEGAAGRPTEGAEGVSS